MPAYSEIIEWFDPADEMPDADLTVLILPSGEVDTVFGFFDGERWRDSEGFAVGAVAFWAHKPEGPAQ